MKNHSVHIVTVHRRDGTSWIKSVHWDKEDAIVSANDWNGGMEGFDTTSIEHKEVT